jgi:hypothetical protein
LGLALVEKEHIHRNDSATPPPTDAALTFGSSRGWRVIKSNAFLCPPPPPPPPPLPTTPSYLAQDSCNLYEKDLKAFKSLNFSLLSDELIVEISHLFQRQDSSSNTKRGSKILQRG